MFDLHLHTIASVNGQEQPSLPGFLSVNAPRRAARGRAGDQLIILLGHRGELIGTDASLNQALERSAQAYFATSGSVTAAMRAAAESLSKDILAQSRRSTQPNPNGYLLNLAVIRSSILYLGHCGPVHSYVIGKENRSHFYDANSDSRAFGLGQGATLRFFQAELQPGDALLLTPESPATLANLRAEDLQTVTAEDLRLKLIAASGVVAAMLVRFQNGDGKIRISPLSSQTLAQAAPAVAAKPATTMVSRAPVAPVEQEIDFEDEPENDVPAPAPARTETFSTNIQTAPHLPNRIREEPSTPVRPAREAATPREAPRQPQTPVPAPKDYKVPLLRTLSHLLHGGERLQNASGSALGTFLTRMLPGASDEPTALSRYTMVFIAIAVPLVIVTLALAVYFERGQNKLFNYYFEQAVSAATQTQNTTDPATLRSAWNATIHYLDKAETNKTTSDSQALRAQAQDAIDDLDNIERIGYEPAIVGGLADGVSISEIIATSSDIYLLNQNQGNVIRASLTGNGFEVDPDFECAPGPSGSYLIEDLVDMVAMSKGNEFDASIMAIDQTGNVLFCGSGVSPTSIHLEPPEIGWGKIQAIAYLNDTLYVLDPTNNAVWVYNGISALRDAPSMFFGATIPTLTSAIDLASNGDDLYLLHSDGHLTMCTTTYGSDNDPSCTDPATLTDSRLGRQESVNMLPGTLFSKMQYTQPPDPSVYFLNPSDGSIYHFSLRLNLQRQLLPPTGSSDPFPSQNATAFAVASNRMVFVAFDNQIYYGIAP